MPDYFFEGLGRFVCKRSAKRSKSAAVGLGGLWGCWGGFVPSYTISLAPPLCALGELCTMGRKFRSKPPQIGGLGVFGCILSMKYLNNSVNPEYLSECTQGFFPTTRGVRWMAPDRPHTTHRATAGHIKFKSSRPAGARRGPPLKMHIDPTKMTTQAPWDRAEARRGPAVAGAGARTRGNRPRVRPDTGAIGSP